MIFSEGIKMDLLVPAILLAGWVMAVFEKKKARKKRDRNFKVRI